MWNRGVLPKFVGMLEFSSEKVGNNENFAWRTTCISAQMKKPQQDRGPTKLRGERP
jgi:hypothetical protein